MDLYIKNAQEKQKQKKKTETSDLVFTGRRSARIQARTILANGDSNTVQNDSDIVPLRRIEAQCSKLKGGSSKTIKQNSDAVVLRRSLRLIEAQKNMKKK